MPLTRDQEKKKLNTFCLRYSLNLTERKNKR